MPVITIEEARRYYRDAEAVHDFDHVLRVLALAERIAAAEGADLEIVRTAALLHDVERAAGDRTGGDHAAMGAARARAILSEKHAAPDFIQAVAHAIHAHRFRSDITPQTLEAKVVFDADKLDSIGAVGVARAIGYGALHGQRLWGEVPAGYDGRDIGAEHTPRHEFEYKLSKVKDGLYTAAGRAIAEGRHRFMVDFFARMADEIAGYA
ncbi:MAG: HD domain-containing protein [Anaerolineae bacterium]|nr:HD domain-containing protein [Anaerolineae bacterium]